MADTLTGLQSAIVLARQVGDNWCLTQALAVWGSTLERMGDPASARSVVEEAVRARRRVGAFWAKA